MIVLRGARETAGVVPSLEEPRRGSATADDAHGRTDDGEHIGRHDADMCAEDPSDPTANAGTDEGEQAAHLDLK